MKNLYLIGGGGHCRSCIDVIEQGGEYQILGIFDKGAPVGDKVLGYTIIGDDLEIERYIRAENYFLITIGQIRQPKTRMGLFNKLTSLGAGLATVISPRAYVSKHAQIGCGTIVMHDALVNAGVIVADNCILNTKCLIEHDAVIKSHSHIATAAIINGGCMVEEGVFVGSNTVLKQNVIVPTESVISAGWFYCGE